MSDDTPRLSPTERLSAHKAHRLKLWSGFGVTVLCWAGAIVSALYWSNLQDATGLVLVLSCLIAAAISPQIWVSSRFLIVSMTVLLASTYWVANYTDLLPIRFTSIDLLIAWLGCWLVQLLSRKHALERNSALTFSESVDAYTFIHAADEFEPALNVELVRSRRHERAFCLVSLKLDQPLASVVDHDLTRLNQLLKNSIRLIDRLYLSPDPNELLMICPETDKVEVRVLASRVRVQIANIFHVPIAIGWAEFPGDCLTRSELLTEARRMALNHANYRAPQGIGAPIDTSVSNSMKSLSDQSLP